MECRSWFDIAALSLWCTAVYPHVALVWRLGHEGSVHGLQERGRRYRGQRCSTDASRHAMAGAGGKQLFYNAYNARVTIL